MKATIEINDELMRRVEKKADDDGVPLQDVVEDALRLYLSEKRTASGYKLKWTTETGELMPGVDLMDGIKS